ncbi:MAG: prepilin peptidase [Pseudomonadota bacterium]
MIGIFFLAIFPACLIISALTDVYEFKIPNWVSLTLWLGYFPAALLLGAPGELVLQSTFFGFAVFVVCFGLFAVKFFGGGDAKLLAAAAPWIGLSAFVPFLFSMALAGGAVAIFLIAFRKMPVLPVYAHAPWLIRMHQNKHELPYAVAISAGGLWTFPQTPLFQIAFGG